MKNMLFLVTLIKVLDIAALLLIVVGLCQVNLLLGIGFGIYQGATKLAKLVSKMALAEIAKNMGVPPQ